ncbi:MAG TPA: SPW repeat protein [Patescibacteria group bacterium]|nr:SPW repeat protein [Patescibacteria group bacterium]
MREQVKTAGWLNVLAGLWLIISPFVLRFSGTSASTNAIIVGIIVAILALIAATSPASVMWTSWINIILGLWLIISPFIMGFTGGAILANSIILGIIVVALSAWASGTTAKLGTA